MCCSCIQGTWIKIIAQRLHRIRNSVSMDADLRAFMFHIGLPDRKAFLWAFFWGQNRKLSLQTVQTNGQSLASEPASSNTPQFNRVTRHLSTEIWGELHFFNFYKKNLSKAQK